MSARRSAKPAPRNANQPVLEQDARLGITFALKCDESQSALLPKAPVIVSFGFAGAACRGGPGGDWCAVRREPGARRIPGRYNQRVAGVYLSYPFCAQKCAFCNFASGVMPRASKRATARPWPPKCARTAGNGGPKPSTWAAARLATWRIEALAALLALIPGRPWARPPSRRRRRHHPRTRARLGRGGHQSRQPGGAVVRGKGDPAHRPQAHRPDRGRRARRCSARPASPIAISTSSPASPAKPKQAGANRSIGSSASHPSTSRVYMLEVDEDSRLGAEILRGGTRYGAAETPSDDQTAGFYEIAVERLAALGIPRYEISNFARPDSNRATISNTGAWNPTPGSAPMRIPSTGAMRRRKPRERRGLPRRRARPNPRAAYLDGGTLLRGAAADERHTSRSPPSGGASSGPSAGSWMPACSKPSDGSLRLTHRGVLLSNEVFQEFLH